MTEEEFYEYLKKENIILNDKQKQQLDTFYHLLLAWNEKMNLTRITEKKEVYLKHFYDSLTLHNAYDLTQPIHLCDVGTGAGFPGIVLKIVFPNLKVTLIDSLQKRTNYLKDVIARLGLTNITVIHSRGEDYAKKNREIFDVVTARAVTNLNALLEICAPMTKVNGYIIPMKANVEEELKSAKKAFSLLHLTLVNKICFLLPIENSTRTLLVIQKNQKTDFKYPRHANEIKKYPL